jgi:hypothetical protein
MKKVCLFILIATTLTLTACSDDDGANNGAANNGNNGNNGTTDTDTGADSTDDTSPDITEDNLAVLSIQPTTGELTGGTEVSVSGTGFADGATVWFGDTEATTTFVSKFQLDATAPAGAAPGTVDIVVENPGGEQATLTDSFEYIAEGVTLSIGWCRLQHPEATTTTVGVATETIYGRVYSDGCTDGAAECTDISAQVGFGPETGDPTTDASAFTWADATYNPGHTADNNDEFEATLSPQTAGTYTYAYRFSGDGGTTWTYCDFDDADGFLPANMGTLTVNE